jgi:hypothetical protein
LLYGIFVSTIITGLLYTIMIEQIATVEICAAPKIPSGRYLLGLFFILLQCFVWIGASVLTQYMYNESDFESPFLMTYIGVALLALLLPMKLLMDKLRPAKVVETHDAAAPVVGVPDNDLGSGADSFDEALSKASAYSELLEVVSTRSLQHAATKKQWSHKKHVLAALQ